MSKIKEFLKNYKKLIVVAILILAVILLCTGFYNLIFYRASIKDNNDAQLSKVKDKYIELSAKYAQVEEVSSELYAKDALILARLLMLEPADANNENYLDCCADLLPTTNGILILDRDRQTISRAGKIRNTDYTESYYNGLFSGETGEAVIVYDKDGGYSVCVGTDASFLVIQKGDTLTNVSGTKEGTLWKMALHSVGLNRSSYFAAVRTDDGEVIYSDYDGFTGKIVSAVEKEWDYYEIDGSDYYIQASDGTEGIRLLALTPREKIIQRCSSNFRLATALLISAFLILVAYIICLKQEKTDIGQEYRTFGRYFLKNQSRSYKSLTMLVLVIMTAVFLIVSSLNNNSSTLEYLKRETDDCRETAEAVSDLSLSAGETKDSAMYSHAGLAGEFLSLHSEYATKDGMKKLSEALDVEYITLFNADGSTLCTSSPMDHINILDEEESSLYALRYVLMGKEGMAVQGDSERISEDDYIYAVPRRNHEDVADGAIALITHGGVSDSVYRAFEETVDTLFQAKTSQEKTFAVNKNGVIVATSKTDGTVDVEEFAEASLKDGYLGSLKIAETNYLASVTYLESYDWYLYVIMPADLFGSDTLPNYLVVFLLLILMALWMWYDGLGSRKQFEELNREAKEQKKDTSRWERLTVAGKMSRILSVYIYIFSIFLIVTKILLSGETVSSDGATYIVSGQWEKTVSGYSVLGNLCLIFVFFTLIRFVQFLIKRVEAFLGKEGATLCRLISSLVSYVGVLVCAYIVVTNFGVDAAAALASIGIIGFALSFGAQELIKDMISGMFILFEGRFKVGDMIDVDGEWYWIRSIGVRTTVVEGKGGNVRVINNSSMTGIVNIQNALYPVNIDFLVDSRYRTDEIKAIITAELPRIQTALPPVATEAKWKGVQGLSGSGTLYRIKTYCPPLKKGSVGRTIRNELKDILDEHGIAIAKEAIVVHNGDDIAS